MVMVLPLRRLMPPNIKHSSHVKVAAQPWRRLSVRVHGKSLRQSQSGTPTLDRQRKDSVHNQKLLEQPAEDLHRYKLTSPSEADSNSQQKADKHVGNTSWMKRLQGPSSKILPAWLTPRMQSRGLLWLLVGLCATNWVLVKDSGGLDTLTFSAARFLIAAIAFLPFLPQALRSSNDRILPAGIELGVWTAGGYLTQAAGLMTIEASRASFISAFTVLAVPFLASSRFGDGREIKWSVWLSALGAMTGVALLEQGGGSPLGVGDVWSLASAILFGIQIYRTEKLSREIPTESVLPLMSISLTTIAAISLLTAAAAQPSQAIALVSQPFASFAAMSEMDLPWQQALWTGLLSTDLALLLELTALTNVSSIEASVVYTAEPVLGAGLAFLFLGEHLNSIGLFGAALIVASSLGAQIVGAGDEPDDMPAQ